MCHKQSYETTDFIVVYYVTCPAVNSREWLIRRNTIFFHFLKKFTQKHDYKTEELAVQVFCWRHTLFSLIVTFRRQAVHVPSWWKIIIQQQNEKESSSGNGYIRFHQTADAFTHYSDLKIYFINSDFKNIRWS